MIIKDSRRKDIENKTIFAHANKTGYIFKQAETADMPDKNRRIEIMGIVNITDDSYFAASRCLGADGRPEADKVLSRIGMMLDEGADIIDIGACSTRPGSEPVGEDTEWERLAPVLEAARKKFPHARISIDTYWSSVVRKAYDLIGPFIVNKKGTPQTMQNLCRYTDVTAEVLEYFNAFAAKAEKAGIKDWILDPGFGFAKTIDQNYRLLADLRQFTGLRHRILVGVSRKSMIYKLLNITPEESLSQTQVLHLAALERGADILRVHDVAEAVRTVQVYRQL